MRALSRRTLLLVGLVWIVFLSKAVFYASVLPLWEGYDEFSHFDFVQSVAINRQLPTVQANGSREISESLRVAPLPWLQRRSHPGGLSHDDFWQRPEAEREVRLQRFRSLPVEWAREPADPRRPLYEAQQPPLSYWLFALPYRGLALQPLLARVWILRLAASLIASLPIPLGFRFARLVFQVGRWSLAAILVAAAVPELMLDGVRVSIEPLAIALATACVWVLLLLSREPPRANLIAVAFGCLLGAGLLTKAYFLALFPAMLGMYAVLWFRDKKLSRTLLAQMIMIVSLALAIAAWWYARAFALTGTFTGQQEDIAARNSAVSVIHGILSAQWFRIADFTLMSHIWLGVCSFLVVRSWMYLSIECLFLVALFGIARRLMARSRDEVGRSTLLVLLLPQFFLWLGLAYHALASFRSHGALGTFGYYAYCFVIPQSICLILGLRAWLPRSMERCILPLLVVCFSALELYAVNITLLPYYSGFTAHSSSGSVPALHFSQLLNGGAHQLFERLAAGKTSAGSVGGSFILWLLFLLGILAGVVGCFPSPFGKVEEEPV